MFIGTGISGFTADYYKVDNVHQWKEIWFVPFYIAVAALTYFIFFFKEQKEIRPAV
jgi:hypothetical protein